MLTHPLTRYISIADAVAKLFHPNVEVIIHEIATDAVFHIANPVSGRKTGDISLLGMDSDDLGTRENIIGPYEKAGEKGQRLRSITTTLQDDDGLAIGLMCMNLDYSGYEPALDLLERLIRPPQTEKHPEFLFQNDWRDQIKLEVRSFTVANNLTLENLSPESRKQLITQLDARGLFYAKKSIEQFAAHIGVSRATAYKDLSAIRKTNGVKPFKKERK